MNLASSRDENCGHFEILPNMLTAKLIDSVAAGDLTNAVECLKEGANPNTLSSDGATAMHIAAGVGVEAVRLMLAYGGNPNVRSGDGSTPLHVAAAWGDKETLRLLLHNGADPAIVDQDGQRAVDVARCEQHEACVDFLKYYAMLVSIGDEEEDPMYTAEPVETTQAEPLAYVHQPPSPQHQMSYVSSDEDDPVNLSSEYSDSLSRRLGRLLHEGSSACLDVTSPDCPYIADKRHKKMGAADRTINEEDCGTALSDSSDSFNNENEQLFSESYRECHCHSNHCCIHKEGNESRTESTGRCSDLHCSDKPASPEHYDPGTNYARSVEKRMRQKYFPDLDVHGGMSSRQGTVASRQATVGYGNRSLESLSTCTSCQHSYLRSASPQQDQSFGGSRLRSTSPCGHFSRHNSDPSTGSRLSRPRHRASCEETRHCYALHHSPHKAHCSTVSTSSHHPQQQRSPCSKRLQCSECGRTSHNPTSRTGHQSSCTPSIHRSPHCCGERLSSPSSHRSSTESYHAHWDHHEAQACCGKECSAHFNTSLRKQTTYPPAAKSGHSPCKPRSPVTIMSVLGGPQSPPPGVFSHFGISPPRTKFSPRPKKSMFTDIQDDSRKDIPLAGSHSSQSVDSGYCERYASRKCPYLDEMNRGKDPTESKAWSSAVSPLTSPTASNTLRSNSHGKAKETSVMSQRKTNTHPSRHAGEKLRYFGSDKSHSPFQDEKDNYTILSSNMCSRTKGKVHKNAGGVSTTGEETDNTRTERTKQAALPDLSVSSTDSFCTCEEASEPEVDPDTIVENKARYQSSKSQLPQPPKNDQRMNTLAAERAATNLKKSPQVAAGKKTQKIPKRESFGFAVSKFDESQVSPSSLDGKNGAGLSNCLSKQPQQDRKNRQYTNLGAENDRPVMSSSGTAHVRTGHVILPDVPKNQTGFPANAKSMRHSGRKWAAPEGPILDDSDLLTSDESFLARPESGQSRNPGSTLKSNDVSKWLENLTVTARGSNTSKAKPEKVSSAAKRLSDESLLSVASTVQEVVYRDKENGITLIERHIPSDCGGSSGRSSIESANSLMTDETVSYDWTDFIIGDEDMSSSSSLFDVTAGQTMNSQETLLESQGDSGSKRFVDDNNGADDVNENLDDSNPEDMKKHNNSQRKQASYSGSTDCYTSSQQTVSTDTTDQPGGSGGDIPSDLVGLSSEAIHQSLKDFGEDPGPVLPSTRQMYLRRLASLRSGKCRLVLSPSQPGYSSELNRFLSGSLDVEELASTELLMVAQFQTADGRTWREGTIKSCFNYLLLDPRVTKNLPLRAKALSNTEAFKTFLSAVFYIGKGKRSRPYCHLYEAISQLKSPKQKVSQKVQQILDIWSAGVGVVSLHCFQNVIPVEAYTREACMVDAIGLGHLTNIKRGDYYGVASTWPPTRRRCMGAYLLQKAFQIFLSEGERQICPPDIKRGQ